MEPEREAAGIAERALIDARKQLDAGEPCDFERYRRDPALWFDHFVAPTPAAQKDGIELHSYQRRIFEAFREHDRVAVRGPHGLGKTFTAAFLVLWFATISTCLGADWKNPTTATAWRQLTKFLWPEIRRLVRYVDWDALGLDRPVRHTDLLDLSLKIGDGEAFAAASDDPMNLEGVHGKRIFYVYDEAKGIARESWEATEGAFSNAGPDTDNEAFAYAISTPGPKIGEFYDIHRGRREDWHYIHVTLQETIDAGQNSAEWAEKRGKEWGVTSGVYRNRVLGEFAADDKDSLIPTIWVEQAMDRWREWDAEGRIGLSGGVRFGVDVARQGSDKTVIAQKRGHAIVEIDVESYTDNVSDLGDRVADIMGRYAYGTSACVDGDGMGAGTGDRMRKLIGDERVTVFLGNQRDEWTDVSGELQAFNNRSAAWWNVRQMLDPALDHMGPRLMLPPSDELLGDLTAPRKVADGSGKIRVESKEQTKKRLGRSPDCLVAGTLIETTAGPIPIEEIDAGGEHMVRTPFGFSPVLATVHQVVDEIWSVQFTNGVRLSGKADHRVCTSNRGWVRLASLRQTDTVVYGSWSSLKHLQALKPWSTTAGDIGFKHLITESAATISQAARGQGKARDPHCIAPYIETSTAKYLTDTTFTTSTTTHSTTTPETWDSLNAASIGAITCLTDGLTATTGTERSRHSTHPGNWHQIGMGPTRERNGTGETVLPCGRKSAELNGPLSSRADFAAVHSKLSSPPPNFATREHVIRSVIDPREGTRTPLPLASFALRTLSLTDTVHLASAPSVVQRSSGRPVSVYDLTLLHDNAYWANGVLVENCADAVIYACWQPPPTPPPPIEWVGGVDRSGETPREGAYRRTRGR